MGWSFHYGVPASPKDELDKLLTWTSENGNQHRVLKSAFVGSTYYAAVETAVAGGGRSVWAAVCLTKTDRRKDEWGHKDMSEDMGPVESKCPMSILKLLTPTKSDYANEWRKRCVAHASKPTRKWVAGLVVKYGPAMYELVAPAGPHRGWHVRRVSDGREYRMKATQLAQSIPA